jgi:hypothetical protein
LHQQAEQPLAVPETQKTSVAPPSAAPCYHSPGVRLLLLPVQSLRDEMTRVEEDLLEADAKNRLYYLLGERTRREHMAIDQKVRAALAGYRLYQWFACSSIQPVPMVSLQQHARVLRDVAHAGSAALCSSGRIYALLL